MPAKVKLSRDRVLRAALALVDAEGVEALSMRRLGAALGVEAMSLYRHVPSKEALLDGVVELLFAELDRGAAGDDWRATLERMLAATRALALAHPRAYPLLALRELVTPEAIEQYEQVVGRLVRDGFSDADARLAFRTVASFANGHLLEEVAADPNGEHPEVFTPAWDWGVRAVLAGIAARR